MTITRADAERMDFSDVSDGERLAPVTPGDVLREEFMAPLGLSARALARDMGVPANRITEILNGERAVTAETAVLLERRFGSSAEFWMGLQASHDLEAAREAMGRAA
jgi:addiction module HigA family antidote